MSKILKPTLIAAAAALSLAVWMPAQADTAAPMARETHADVHSDKVEMKHAMADRARDRRALAKAEKAHNKEAIAHARADLRRDNAHMARLHRDMMKDKHNAAHK